MSRGYSVTERSRSLGSHNLQAESLPAFLSEAALFTYLQSTICLNIIALSLSFFVFLSVSFVSCVFFSCSYQKFPHSYLTFRIFPNLVNSFCEQRVFQSQKK